MKKIFVFLTAIMLIASMAIPAYAMTPPLDVPDVPQISDIEFDIKIELPDDVFDDYIPDIEVEVPTEPPAAEPVRPDWHGMVKCWIGWWANAVKKYCDKLPGMR